ncbi:hypothetical protein [Spirosoma pomorum]|jgi:hypothetical protein
MNSKLIIGGIGVLLVAGSFWVNGDFVIQLYATYYVIGWGVVLKAIGLSCCLIGGIYFLRKRLVHQ